MVSGPNEEARQHPRTLIELKVEYRKLNTFFYDYTRNISKGGTFIKTPRPLDVGTEFLFKLTVPKIAAPLTLRGQVMWTVTEQEARADPEKREAGMGIQFVYDSERERKEIEETVETLMKEQLGERAHAKLMGKG